MSGLHYYQLPQRLALPGHAPKKFAELTSTEVNRGGRIIGGDQGDIHFMGYVLEDDPEITVLIDPELRTTHATLSPDEVMEVAEGVLAEAFASIGMECLR